MKMGTHYDEENWPIVTDVMNVCYFRLGFCCLFPCELRYSWFFVCHLILDCILELLNIMWWNSGSWLNSVENVDIFVLAGSLDRFRPQVPTWFLWAVVLIPDLFPKPLQSLWICPVCAPPSLEVWYMGCLWSLRAFFKSLSFSRSTQMLWNDYIMS